jgi:hypothetical protein
MSTARPDRDQVRIGGLMRCCTGTIGEYYQDDPAKRAAEGEKLKCRYSDSPDHGNMIFRDGAWEWDRLRDVMS